MKVPKYDPAVRAFRLEGNLFSFPIMDSAYILTSSYYCCRHRIGSIVISIMDLIAALIGIITVATQFPEKPLFEISGLPPIFPQLRTAIIISLVAVILTLVAGIVLLVGVYKRWSLCVLGYLILSIFAMLLCWVSWGLSIRLTPWFITIAALILLVLSLYHWMIAFSYFIILIAAGDGTSDASGLSNHGILQRVSL